MAWANDTIGLYYNNSDHMIAKGAFSRIWLTNVRKATAKDIIDEEQV